MDRYNERLVNTKYDSGSVIGLTAAILVVVVGIVLILFVYVPFGLFAIAGGIALINIAKDYFKLEYEFIITNGDIEMAKIIAKKKRKTLGVLESDNISRMAYADDDKVKNDISLGKIKVSQYLGTDEGGTPVAIYEGEGENQKLYILDFDDRCIEHMNLVLKQKSEIKLNKES